MTKPLSPARSGSNSSKCNPMLARAVIALFLLMGGALFWCAGHSELISQEAYYWTYAKHPALSYYDHPPMVAWLIGMGTVCFGDTELGVRFLHLSLYFGSAFLMFLTARAWFGWRTAFWAALIFAATPFYIATGFIASPDGPLIFFWLLTLYTLSRALQEKSTRWWFFSGLALGAAMLSKYPAVVLVPSFLLFLFFSPQHRFWLRRPQPWMAACVAVLVFSPVIVWNAQHDWASFLFQSTRTMAQGSHKPIHRILEFWAIQPLLLTPFLFVLFGIGAVRAIQRGWLQHDERWNFAVSFALPILLICFLSGLKTDHIRFQWTAPAYLSLTLAGAAVFAEGTGSEDPRRARHWQRFGWAAGVFSAAVILLGLSFFTLGLPKISAVRVPLGCWRELANKVEAAEARLQAQTGREPFILGFDKYKMSASLGFYSGEPEKQVNRFALGQPGFAYRYWTDLQAWKGRPAIAVLAESNESDLDTLRKYFDRVSRPSVVQVTTVDRRTRTFYLADCYGYRPAPEAPILESRNCFQEGAVLRRSSYPAMSSCGMGETLFLFLFRPSPAR